MWRWLAGGIAAFAALAAVALWAISEPEVPRAVLEAKYATPPSQFLVLADGTRLHYRDRGPRDGPVLIVLHGFSGSLFIWESWSRALSDRFRVISLDLPGHGLTGAVPSGDYSQGAMVQSVKAVADRLGLDRFALAGVSMGGGVAARFAELYPKRVSHLILIDAAGARTSTRPRLHLSTMAANLPVIDRFFLYAVMKRMPELAHMEGSPQAILEHFRLADDTYVWNHVGAIKAPVLILWGGNDQVIPIAGAYAWHNAIPGSKLIVYPGAGHVSMADAPQSARDVREFLGTEPRPSAGEGTW